MAEAYEAGLRAALEAAGGVAAGRPTSIYIGFDGYANHEEYERLMDAALVELIVAAGGRAPTAIFTGFDAVAELIYLQLMRHGVSVPDDMSLVSFGGATRLGPMQHRLAAVTVDEAMVGRLAADLLVEMRSRAGGRSSWTSGSRSTSASTRARRCGRCTERHGSTDMANVYMLPHIATGKGIVMHTA